MSLRDDLLATFERMLEDYAERRAQVSDREHMAIMLDAQTGTVRVLRDAVKAGDLSYVRYGVQSDQTDIQLWFELTYAQYLTIPRSVLQSMPKQWQYDFVALLEQLDDTIDWRPKHRTQYRVTLHQMVEQFDEELGTEADTWGPELPDPFQDYERGRRRIAHRTDPQGEADGTAENP